MNCWNWVLSHFLTAVSSSMWSMLVLVGIFSPWRLLSTFLLWAIQLWFFSAIKEYFQEHSLPNIPSSEVYSEHDNLFAVFSPLALYEPLPGDVFCSVKVCAGQNWKVLSGLRRMKMCSSLRAEICSVLINLCWKDGVIFWAQCCGVGQRAGFWYYGSVNGE